MITLTLPWPPKELSPNARVHWSKRYSAGKKQKNDARVLAALSDLRGLVGAQRVAVGLVFHPPAAFRYDVDNLVACMKSALDGVAWGIGIDDANFRLEAPIIAEPRPPHGCVIVTLWPLKEKGAA